MAGSFSSSDLGVESLILPLALLKEHFFPFEDVGRNLRAKSQELSLCARNFGWDLVKDELGEVTVPAELLLFLSELGVTVIFTLLAPITAVSAPSFELQCLLSRCGGAGHSSSEGVTSFASGSDAEELGKTCHGRSCFRSS